MAGQEIADDMRGALPQTRPFPFAGGGTPPHRRGGTRNRPKRP